MIEATTFPDVEAAVIAAIKPFLAGVIVSNKTPSPITGKVVTIGFSGGGRRDWGEASVNVGVNVYAQTDSDCRGLAITVQDHLAATSDDLIEGIRTPAGGGTVIVGQQPPYQRYFVITVMLRAQSLLDLS